MLQRFREVVADIHESFLQGLNEGEEAQASLNANHQKKLNNRWPLFDWFSSCTSHTSSGCLPVSLSPKHREANRLNGTVCEARTEILRSEPANTLRGQSSGHSREQVNGPYLLNHETGLYGSRDGQVARTQCAGTFSHTEPTAQVNSLLGHFEHGESSPSLSYRNVDIEHVEHPTIDVDYGHRYTQSRYEHFVSDDGNPYLSAPLDKPSVSTGYGLNTAHHSHSTRNGKYRHAEQPDAHDAPSDAHHTASRDLRRIDSVVVPKLRMSSITKERAQQHVGARRHHGARWQKHCDENAPQHSARISDTDNPDENKVQFSNSRASQSDAAPRMQQERASDANTEFRVSCTDAPTRAQNMEQLDYDDDAARRRHARGFDGADYNMKHNNGSRGHRQTRSPTQAGQHEQQQQEHQEHRYRECHTPSMERAHLGEDERRKEEQHRVLRGLVKRKSTTLRTGRSRELDGEYKEVVRPNANSTHQATRQQKEPEKQEQRVASESTERSLSPLQQCMFNDDLVPRSAQRNVPAYAPNRPTDRRVSHYNGQRGYRQIRNPIQVGQQEQPQQEHQEHRYRERHSRPLKSDGFGEYDKHNDERQHSLTGLHKRKSTTPPTGWSGELEGGYKEVSTRGNADPRHQATRQQEKQEQRVANDSMDRSLSPLQQSMSHSDQAPASVQRNSFGYVASGFTDKSVSHHNRSRGLRQARSPIQGGQHEQQQQEYQWHRHRDRCTRPIERGGFGEFEKHRDERQHSLTGPHKRKSTTPPTGWSGELEAGYKEVSTRENADPPHRATRQQEKQEQRVANDSMDRNLSPLQQCMSHSDQATGSVQRNSFGYVANGFTDKSVSYHNRSRGLRQARSPIQGGQHEQQQQEYQWHRHRDRCTRPIERGGFGEYEKYRDEQQHALAGPHKRKPPTSPTGRSHKLLEEHKETLTRSSGTSSHQAARQQDEQEKRTASDSTGRSLSPLQQCMSHNDLVTRSSQGKTPTDAASGSAGRSVSPFQPPSNDRVTQNAQENDNAQHKNKFMDGNLSPLRQRVSSGELSVGSFEGNHLSCRASRELDTHRRHSTEHFDLSTTDAYRDKGDGYARTPYAKGRGHLVESKGHSHSAQNARQLGKGPSCFPSREKNNRASANLTRSPILESSCRPKDTSPHQSKQTDVMIDTLSSTRDSAAETNEDQRNTAESMQQLRQTPDSSLQPIPDVNSTERVESTHLLTQWPSGSEEGQVNEMEKRRANEQEEWQGNKEEWQARGPQERPVVPTRPASPHVEGNVAMADGATDVMKVPLGKYGLFEPGNSYRARKLSEEIPESENNRNVGPEVLDVGPRVLGSLSKPGTIAQFNPTSGGGRHREEEAKQMPSAVNPPMTTGRKLGAGSIRKSFNMQ